ncbi:MAG: LemA-like protein [Candidatus Uhrbacteria bacterium GW2011_GWD2_41_121]|uniref:LemA-like protein n=1 Tax=Candidatus Uhrbacteria bacterium GW2011_GWC1_41_20 TaxID=1618983 RepID=A0A0G0YH22_9BACT|nr:MAG: LemA-like protein [Candidatus Uhrbacteria bacterium GW2011_GWE1_39_46]KKR64223.1 MAG: LemA-like protein [Candidatus Uhrbacteria bacterium GW2011_GWC2_40_450]KKR90356.1 MAG: LemA-like protein [Candidatus Uhrbacteria bacterium GW2011_GWD2_41_121]KKR96259.1 MAG: LemA-like protein [Candidatus Uhrbacteria bacterium GW2011_GWD1_41_16]KKR99632.1 MAG: LemA-like protein [Candidatus Uhrbacteria bacterium GW2011_GWC1_41_20]KKS06217.1 MAG: LemA-like protein [Candidatus Uhrbacteria bacterium GW2011
MEILYIILGVVAVIVLWLVMVFNGLIRLRNRTDEAWSDIEVQLKRRYDLIPNLVNTVKGYAKHEDSVFSKVTEARSHAMQAKTPADHAKAEGMLTETLKSLFAVSENYPDLKASGNFLHLQQELVDAEDKIQASRRFYNGNVRDFNTKMQVFPTNMIASMLGFKKYDFFDAPDSVNIALEVQF